MTPDDSSDVPEVPGEGCNGEGSWVIERNGKINSLWVFTWTPAISLMLTGGVDSRWRSVLCESLRLPPGVIKQPHHTVWGRKKSPGFRSWETWALIP